MAQMASLLVVATVFVALWTLNIYILQSERGGAYTRDKTTYAGTWAKIAGGGGLYARGGGVFAGFYGIKHSADKIVTAWWLYIDILAIHVYHVCAFKQAHETFHNNCGAWK